MVFYNLNALSMSDFSALNDGDSEKWREKLMEGIDDKEKFLITEVRWTWSHRAKMMRQLRTYQKALRILKLADTVEKI